jgi:outer membrane protein assembly factor BamE (lipoprotein component of BamABCDE complex)
MVFEWRIFKTDGLLKNKGFMLKFHFHFRFRLPTTVSRAVLSYAIAILLGACTIYNPELKQGNLLNPEQIAKLQVGLPKSQVLLLLGSPLLEDVFHANRWEYIYRQIKGDKTLEQHLVTVEFDNSGKVSKWSSFVPNKRPER